MGRLERRGGQVGGGGVGRLEGEGWAGWRGRGGQVGGEGVGRLEGEGWAGWRGRGGLGLSTAHS